MSGSRKLRKFICKLGVAASSMVLLPGVNARFGQCLPAENNMTTLTASERKMADEIGFDQRALSIVKELTKSELLQIDLNYAFKYEAANASLGIEKRKNDSHDLQTDADTLEHIAHDTPALKPALDPLIKQMRSSIVPKETISKEVLAEYKEAVKRYGGYILQRSDSEGRYLPVAAVDPMASPFNRPDEGALKRFIEYLENFDGKPLEDRYKPKKCILFFIPVPTAYKNISLSSACGADMILELQSRLSSIGYSAYASDVLADHQLFDSPEAAQAYAKGIKVPPCQVVIRPEQEPWTYETIFDPRKPMTPPTGDNCLFFGIVPGMRIHKLENNKWNVILPQRTTVDVSVMTGVLMKSRVDAHSTSKKARDKFEFVRFARTAAPNHELTNDQIVQKLEDWDRRYGLNLISAQQGNLIVDFKALPGDIGPLCEEILSFCPDLNSMYGPEWVKSELQRTRRLSLWWG